MTSDSSTRWLWLWALAAVLSGCLTSRTHSPASHPFGKPAVTYAMAQQVRWLDSERFLVGRWDGTISLLEAPAVEGSAARLVDAMVLPDGEGVRMLVTHSPRVFVSSAGEDALLIWRAPEGAAFTPTSVHYAAAVGPAVSGLFVSDQGQDHLVTGHESGHLLIWSVGEDAALMLRHTVDLRLAEAIDYEHADEPLRHIRGLAAWRDGIIIAGGEDGGLHQVRLEDGAVLTQRLFNPAARLGINDLAVHGDSLLVVNCATDKRDRNLWLFALQAAHIGDTDAVNLLRDRQQKRIFAFDVVTYEQDGVPLAAVSTKEGLLWSVRFSGDGLEPVGHTSLGRFFYGSAIDYDAVSGRIAAAGISVRVVPVQPSE